MCGPYDSLSETFERSGKSEVCNTTAQAKDLKKFRAGGGGACSVELHTTRLLPATRGHSIHLACRGKDKGKLSKIIEAVNNFG